MLEPSFCLDPCPDCEVVTFCFRCPFVFERELVFSTIDSRRNGCIVVLHERDVCKFVPGPDVRFWCPADQLSRSFKAEMNVVQFQGMSYIGVAVSAGVRWTRVVL